MLRARRLAFCSSRSQRLSNKWQHATRSSTSVADVRKSIGVVPAGVLKANSGGLSLDIGTEDQKCDQIWFEDDSGGSCCAKGLQLTSPGTLLTQLEVDAPTAADRAGLRGLIPEKYDVDIETQGGELCLGRLEGAAHLSTVRCGIYSGPSCARST